MVLAVWVSICSQPCAEWINNHHDLHLSSLSATLDKNMPNDYLDTQVVNRIEWLFVKSLIQFFKPFMSVLVESLFPFTRPDWKQQTRFSEPASSYGESGTQS